MKGAQAQRRLSNKQILDVQRGLTGNSERHASYAESASSPMAPVRPPPDFVRI